MKKFIFIFIPLLITVMLIASCAKQFTAEDYPTLLINCHVTPGKAEKEVAVFLYTTKKDVKFTIVPKGKDKIILDLQNTFKAKKINELDVSGVEEFLTKAIAVQHSNKTSENNPVTTRIVFTVKDPKTIIKPVIQARIVEVETIQKAADNSTAADVIAVSMGPKTDVSGIYPLLVFLVIVAGLIATYWFFNKSEEVPIRRYVEVEEEETTSDLEEIKEEYPPDKDNENI